MADNPSVSQSTYDVIVIGAGPVGLLLACELSIAGVQVLLLERASHAPTLYKSGPLGLRGLNTPSLEVLHRRGLLSKLMDLDQKPQSFGPGAAQYGGHFAGIPLDASKIEMDRYPYRLPGPTLVPAPTTIQALTDVLAQRAQELGVRITYNEGFESIAEHTRTSVSILTTAKAVYHCKWLVGCDGGRSAVRKASGFQFEGTTPSLTGYALQCELNRPQALKPGFNATKAGMYINGRKGALHVIDFDGGQFDRSREVDLDLAQEVLHRIMDDEDLEITKLHTASTWTDQCRLASSYRKGRILLAGDAAHIHSPFGAQGLNAGIGDAVNLGWKLAATIRRQAESNAASSEDLSLLDTYEQERRPVGQWLLEWTRVQASITTPTPQGSAMKGVFQELSQTKDGANYLIDRFMGLSQHCELKPTGIKCEYYARDHHPSVGFSAPEFTFVDGSRMASRFAAGKALLMEFDDHEDIKNLVSRRPLAETVTFVGTDVQERLGIRALVIRPDGVIAWASGPGYPAVFQDLQAILDFWFQ